jgi:hypothetical protein
MKPKYILIAHIISLFNFSGYAQDRTSVLSVNPQFSFFKDNYSENSFSPINPGTEILYEFGLTSKISLATGISYSYSIWKNSIGIKSHFKRLAHEMYFPVILKFRFIQKFFTEFGLYSGWLIQGKELYMNNIDVKDWIDNTENTNYSSSSKFSADLYFGAGFNHVINEKRTIRVIPFVKYKLKDNWMSEIRERISAGLKINFVFNFNN